MSEPRPPKVNLNFSEADMPLPRDIFKLRQRFKFFEDERRNKQTEKTYIALEAITAFCGGRGSGYSDDDLRAAWPQAWGETSVEIPFVLLKELADAWVEYQVAPPGKTFGEVLGIEGGGQGKQKTRDRRKVIDTQIHRTNRVLLEYGSAALKGAPISLDEAKEIVAAELKVSIETIEAAYKKQSKRVRKELYEAGLFLKR